VCVCVHVFACVRDLCAKVTKLGEPLSNDKLRASYVSLVSEDCSRESFDDTGKHMCGRAPGAGSCAG